jgi:acyl-coenzyme A thioesterase 9
MSSLYSWLLIADIMPEALIPTEDITIRGHVTWVGTTSIEVSMNVEQVQNGNVIPALAAKFVIVARDPMNKRYIL